LLQNEERNKFSEDANNIRTINNYSSQPCSENEGTCSHVISSTTDLPPVSKTLTVTETCYQNSAPLMSLEGATEPIDCRVVVHISPFIRKECPENNDTVFESYVAKTSNADSHAQNAVCRTNKGMAPEQNEQYASENLIS